MIFNAIIFLGMPYKKTCLALASKKLLIRLAEVEIFVLLFYDISHIRAYNHKN